MSTASQVVFVGAVKKPSFICDTKTVPTIKEGEVLAKIRLATICGSDLRTILGTTTGPIPSVLGHEAVAEVIEDRRDDDTLPPGTRVTFSISVSCRKCERCQAGLLQNCPNIFKYGHVTLNAGHGGFSGCFATHIVLRPGTTILPLPESIPDTVAAPINCALATAISAVQSVTQASSGAGENKSALVQGASLLGVYTCAYLRDRGYSRVYCTDACVDRLLITQKYGATPISTAIKCEYPADDTIDAVFEVGLCGDPSDIEEGLRLLRPGGHYVLVGLGHSDSKLDFTGEKIIGKSLTIKGVQGYAPEHLVEAVRFLEATAMQHPYAALLSPPYRLCDVPGPALEQAQRGMYHRVAIAP